MQTRERTSVSGRFPVIMLLVACASCVLSSCEPAPRRELPLPANIDDLEDNLAARVRSAAARIREAEEHPDRWMELGNIYLAHGLYSLAAQCYDRAEPLGTPNARFFYLRSYARIQVGRFDDALSDLYHVIALDASYLPAYWRSGLLLLDKGELDSAQQQFRRGLDVDGTSAHGWLGLARVHLARREGHQAVSLLEPLLKTHPEYAGYINHLLGTAYRQLGRVDEARTAMRASGGGVEITDPWVNEIDRYRTEGFGNRLMLVSQLLSEKKVDRAIQILNELHAEDPKHSFTLASLAAAYLMKEEYDKSIEYSLLALEQKPSYFALETLALTYHIMSLGDSPRADEYDALATRYVDQAIELNPSLTSSLYIKGKILARNGRYDEAIRTYKQAYRIGGRSATRFSRRTKQGYVPQTSVDWLFAAGKLEWELERWEDAIRTLNEVIEHWPDRAIAHYYLGVAYMRTGQLDRAELSLASADRLSPGSRFVREAVQQLRALDEADRERGE